MSEQLHQEQAKTEALTLALERCRMTLEHYMDRREADPHFADETLTASMSLAIRTLSKFGMAQDADYWEKVFSFDPDKAKVLRQAQDDISAAEVVTARRHQVIQRVNGLKFVCVDAYPLKAGERIVCDSPHEDGDYSYLCNFEFCRCSE